MNMQKWRESILESTTPVLIPIMTHPGIEQLGYTVRVAVTSGSVHAKAVGWLAGHYPTAAATVIMDLTVEAEAFGADVLFPEDEIPTVTGRLLKSRDDIWSLRVPSLGEGRIREYVKACLLAHEDITDRPVLAGCIGPFSLAGRLFDMSEIMMLTCSDKEAAHELLRKCTEFILKYVTALKATGVEGVVMAEPAAGLLSDADCQTFSSDYVKRIVDAVQDDGFIVVLHNCGNTGHCTKAMVRTGAKALHIGNKCDMLAALADMPDDVLLMGNLDPVGIFKMSQPETVAQATKELIEKTMDHRNVVISTGCDTPPHCPMENINAFFNAAR